MKVCKTLFAMFAILCATLAIPGSTVCSQDKEQSPNLGWLEGRVVNEAGEPLGGVFFDSRLNLQRTDGSILRAENSDISAGGLYTMRNVPPGSYEFVVKRMGQSGVEYAPMHFFGVNIEAGKRTVLNIVMKPGTELVEIGQPALSSQKVIIVSQELARLQKEIDALKKQMGDERR